jgi:microcin C transport system substrate-binding protein
MNRRSLLGSTVLAVTALPLTWPRSIGAALADDKSWRHGVSLFGNLKYPAGFRHFEYVNVDAPKGGTAREAASGTFDNFNGVVAGVKGSLATGIDLIYETLLVSSLDEIATGYGLLAEAVSFPADFSSVTYRLREQAKWHDGTPVMPDNVIFSFEAVKKYSPQLPPDILKCLGDQFLHVCREIGFSLIVDFARGVLAELLTIRTNLLNHSVFGSAEC